MAEQPNDSLARNTYFDRQIGKPAAKLLPGEYYVTDKDMVLVTVLGGALGLAGAWWLGVQFEPVFRQYLPGFKVPPDAIAAGAVFMVVLGLVAGAVPALQAMRLSIVAALRRD